MSCDDFVPNFLPMGWNCHDGKNCFNIKQRLKFQAFKPFLPDGDISFTDIDGLCNIDNHFLFIESKSNGTHIKRGQEIFFERITKLAPENIRAMIIHCNAETMECFGVRLIENGVIGGHFNCDLPHIQNLIAEWVEIARPTLKGVDPLFWQKRGAAPS